MRRRIGRLYKHHRSDCGTHGEDEDCTCPWKGRYRHREVTLKTWLQQPIDPRSRRDGERALARLVQAVDNHTFTQGAPQRRTIGKCLLDFIDEWTTHYAEKHELTSTSLRPMLGVLKRSRLGKMTLTELAEESTAIERELDTLGKTRKWKAVTWNSTTGCSTRSASRRRSGRRVASRGCRGTR